MTGFGFFQPAIAAMTAQSQALSVIGGNIANVTTDGFKRGDVSFQGLVSRTWASAPAEINAQSRQSDLGGVAANVHARIGETGELGLTGRALDAAIDGPGLFVFRDAGGGLLYGRGGRFETMPDPAADGATSTAFLGDGEGRVLQGWPISADGGHATDAGGLVPVRVDAEAAGTSGQATSLVRLGFNLPGAANAGAAEGYDLGAFDAAGRAHPLRLDFTREPLANTWGLAVTASAGETLTIDPPAVAGWAPGATAPGQPLSFASDGTLNGPGRYTIGITHADGSTSQFTLDMSAATQYAGPFAVQTADQDGLPPGRLADVSIDDQGRVLGRFDNGQVRPLYQLPLADFANANGLEALDGNLYRPSALSGEPTLAAAGGAGVGRIAAGAVERSNVKLEAEFARMMVTQNAYNSAATAFRTLDEMAELARDIKR